MRDVRGGTALFCLLLLWPIKNYKKESSIKPSVLLDIACPLIFTGESLSFLSFSVVLLSKFKLKEN
jgi:hypothetical protein